MLYAAAAVEYREYEPRGALASVARCIWTLQGDASELGDEPVQRILADGRPELVMHFGDAFERMRADGTADRQAPVLFAGQITSHLLLRPTGRIATIGVRFHAHGAAALFRCPQHELADVTVDVGAVSRPLARSLSRVRESAASLNDARHAVEEGIGGHVDLSRLKPHVEAAVGMIRRHRGSLPIERVASRLGVTRRHLERQFNDTVGIPPKRLARIVRLQHALSVLERADVKSPGAHTASTCGYADQAHFVRECQQLCGCAPGAHVMQVAQLTGFFRESQTRA
jgi:AraC-like DNA-binding protein